MSETDQQSPLWTASVGNAFSGPRRVMSIERILAFSSGVPGEPGWPQKNLHTDEEKAQEAGLPAIIASGTQSEGHLIELMIDLFGDFWHRTGVIDLKLPKSVLVNDSVQGKAILREVHETDDGRKCDLDVWCENQDGDKVLVGNASGRLLK